MEQLKENLPEFVVVPDKTSEAAASRAKAAKISGIENPKGSKFYPHAGLRQIEKYVRELETLLMEQVERTMPPCDCD
jgi:hypothetical protein